MHSSAPGIVHSRSLVASIGVACVVIVGSVAAQAVAVVPCARDNTLYESAAGSFSNGLGDSLFCGRTAQGRSRRALVYFDVAAALPQDAIVLAASLQLHVIFSTASGPTEVAAHRLQQTWGEGTSFSTAGGGGMGAPSTTGDATWVHASYPNVAWPAGGDFVAVPSFLFTMPTQGSVSTFVNAADVQGWLQQPATNHGWLLKTDEAAPTARARRIDSRESSGPRPALEVSYLQPGATGTWGVGCQSAAGTMTTQWVGVPSGGATMQVVHGNAPATSVGANFFAFEVVPAGVEISPACRVHLPLTGAIVPGDVFVTDGSGGATSALVLPVGVPDQLLVVQAVVLPAAGGLVLGNVAALVTQ